MNCGRSNEWNGMWTEENKSETWTMKWGLKETRWYMINELWTEGNKMKHEQWSR